MSYAISLLLLFYSLYLIISIITKNRYYKQLFELLPTKSSSFKISVLILFTVVNLAVSFQFYAGNLVYQSKFLP